MGLCIIKILQTVLKPPPEFIGVEQHRDLVRLQPARALEIMQDFAGAACTQGLFFAATNQLK
ncbi:MAG: hypothetical protein EBR85_03845 [Betaproteobacteria bacterium]|nr:hypothetical protein [Betaproteobacteria bacterium]